MPLLLISLPTISGPSWTKAGCPIYPQGYALVRQQLARQQLANRLANLLLALATTRVARKDIMLCGFMFT
jgi:hypothetical protein